MLNNHQMDLPTYTRTHTNESRAMKTKQPKQGREEYIWK